MTTRKGFKRLVRARMSKTGESYATARRSLLGDSASTVYDGAARGLHPDTSAVATALARTGIVSPVTGRPLSEALVLVAGGGLGAGYILWEFKGADAAIVTLGFRNRWQYPAAWMVTAIERLGIAHVLHEAGGARAARATMEAILDRGLPAIVAIETARNTMIGRVFFRGTITTGRVASLITWMSIRCFCKALYCWRS